jgi:hypothetical protein
MSKDTAVHESSDEEHDHDGATFTDNVVDAAVTADNENEDVFGDPLFDAEDTVSSGTKAKKHKHKDNKTTASSKKARKAALAAEKEARKQAEEVRSHASSTMYSSSHASTYGSTRSSRRMRSLTQDLDQ